MKQKNKENTEEKRKQVDEVIAKMEQGIKDVFESEKYKNYLKVMSKFYNYSIGNQILISMQNPKATNVLGYKSWQTKFKRQVKKGEKGIKILVPLIYKYDVEVENIDQNGNKNTTTEQRQNTYFKTSTVFDISQTEGKEIEDLNLVEELKFKVENFNSFFKCIKNISPVEIKFEEMKEDVKGYYSKANQEIVIKKGMSEGQILKTAIHELSHAILHSEENNNKGRSIKELEAESVAYVVCNHFDIDTSEYSFGYLAGWSKDKELKELKLSLETIKNTATNLIDLIKNELKEEQDIKVEEEKIENNMRFKM